MSQLYLSDFAGEDKMLAALNKSMALIQSSHLDVKQKIAENTKVYLTSEVYPKINQLGLLVTDPLVINEVSSISPSLFDNPLDFYKFNDSLDLILIAVKAENVLGLFIGSYRIDDVFETELYMFDMDDLLIKNVQNHRFIIVQDDVLGKITSSVFSNMGKYLYSRDSESCTTNVTRNNYINIPVTASATLAKDTLFKR